MLRPDGVKGKRYCGFHDRDSHSINNCRVFRMKIQRAIQEGHLRFDNKMKLDGHPFPQNMVGFSVNMVSAEEKGKVKVLTSARARQDGTVDPERQVTLEQVHGAAPRILKSHIETGSHPKPSPGWPRVSYSTSGSASWRKSATRREDTRRRSVEPKRRHTEGTCSNTRAIRSARTRDVHSSGIVGMRVSSCPC
jgi:hypothetical protein